MNKQSLRILLVEDDPDDARVYQRDLEKSLDDQPYYLRPSITWAPCLAIGLKLLSEEKFDCIVTDLTLPDAQQLEAVTRLHEAQPNLPIIVLSGLENLDVALSSLHAGAQDFLVKGGPRELLVRSTLYALERNSLRIETARAQAVAQEVSRLKTEFLRNVSHELRTPLGGIIGMTDILLLAPSNDEQRDALTSVLECANRLRRVIETILEFSNSVDSSISGTSVVFSFEPQLRYELKEAERHGLDREISVTFKLGAAVPRWLKGDAGALFSTMRVLLDNAVKFNRVGGQIDVSVDYSTDPRSPALVIRVADTGIGIRPEEFSIIYEPFRQADGSPTRQFGGIGLGLALAKVQLDRVGATLSVESAPQQGSTFTLVFPVEELPNSDLGTILGFEHYGEKSS